VIRFYLNRKTDETGISGTGRVAEGVIFHSGKVVLAWLTEHKSVAVYDDLKTCHAIHGHGGKTEIVFNEELCPYCGHMLNDHWGDGCGLCMHGCQDATIPGCYCVLMGKGGPGPIQPARDRRLVYLGDGWFDAVPKPKPPPSP
jgi:hypothetical protein